MDPIHPRTPFQTNVSRQRRRLTRAQNSGDAQQVIDAARDGLASFDEFGYPDDWHRWQRALDDALLDAGREEWAA